MEVSRRQLVRAAAGCLVGAGVATAGCSSGERDVQIAAIYVEETITGLRVDVGFGNVGDVDVQTVVHADVTVEDGEDTETYSVTEEATLPAGQQTDVSLSTHPGKAGHRPSDGPIEVVVRAEFPNSDREPIVREHCDGCG